MRPHERLAAYDKALREKHGPFLMGCDEVGRGAWAGPLAAGAVVLPADADIPGLNDSKKLSHDQREALFDQIIEVALAWHVEYVEAPEIDKRGITSANIRAMSRACQKAGEKLGEPIDLYIVDESPKFPFHPHLMLPKADGTSLVVAAASVLAKVSRDRLMCELAVQHPEYGWDTSMGYINEQHKQAVKKHGYVEGVHRTSYRVEGVFTKQLNLEDLI